MRYIDLLETRDIAIRTEILSQLPVSDDNLMDFVKPLEKAFKNGSVAWAKEYLPSLLGKKEAEEVIRKTVVPGF